MVEDFDRHKMVRLLEAAASGEPIYHEDLTSGWTRTPFDDPSMDDAWIELRLWVADQDILNSDPDYRARKTARLSYFAEQLKKSVPVNT